MSALPVAALELPVVDFSGAAACDDCGAPAGVECAPGCSVWASDDLPLVPFSPFGAGPSDDPRVVPGPVGSGPF
ncbi:MAG: hypothetical protein IPK85_02965 [Gemmatimonadetes bacterium]|nr:hypothetical protein [Gemmatimonadota bacterium]